jgi:NAD-dependent SIR2 family protein deacetylase
MEEIIELITKSNHILIFTGAGISTSCGIPDFRSDDGLYSYAKEKYMVPYPEALFDIDYFENDPRPFFSLSRDLLSTEITPSTTHKMIKKLEDLGKLKYVVTQNIDMLHEKSGNKNVLACHGSYETGTCRSCKKVYTYNQFKESLAKGSICRCRCGCIIKPDITFFGESLPKEFYSFMENPPTVDLVIVMGTSLEVGPANQIPLIYKGKAPLIIVNRDRTIYDHFFDFKSDMDCDDFSNLILNIYKTT